MKWKERNKKESKKKEMKRKEREKNEWKVGRNWNKKMTIRELERMKISKERKIKNSTASVAERASEANSLEHFLVHRNFLQSKWRASFRTNWRTSRKTFDPIKFIRVERAFHWKIFFIHSTIYFDSNIKKMDSWINHFNE